MTDHPHRTDYPAAATIAARLITCIADDDHVAVAALLAECRAAHNIEIVLLAACNQAVLYAADTGPNHKAMLDAMAWAGLDYIAEQRSEQ